MTHTGLGKARSIEHWKASKGPHAWVQDRDSPGSPCSVVSPGMKPNFAISALTASVASASLSKATSSLTWPHFPHGASQKGQVSVIYEPTKGMRLLNS